MRKATTTRGRPERYLGLAFLMDGLSYAFGDLTYVLGIDTPEAVSSFVSRLFSGGCALALALFTWRVFRPDATWARRLVWAVGATVLLGVGVSALEGDWEGVSPLSYRGFWIEWLGGHTPFVWLAVESSMQYLVTRRRIPLGLIDPLVCNRYLLIALYAALGSATYVILVPMCIVYEVHGIWAPLWDLATGIAESGSILALWISFSAPAFYRRWVSGDAATGSTGR